MCPWWNLQAAPDVTRLCYEYSFSLTRVERVREAHILKKATGRLWLAGGVSPSHRLGFNRASSGLVQRREDHPGTCSTSPTAQVPILILAFSNMFMDLMVMVLFWCCGWDSAQITSRLRSVIIRLVAGASVLRGSPGLVQNQLWFTVNWSGTTPWCNETLNTWWSSGTSPASRRGPAVTEIGPAAHSLLECVVSEMISLSAWSQGTTSFLILWCNILKYESTTNRDVYQKLRQNVKTAVKHRRRIIILMLQRFIQRKV